MKFYEKLRQADAEKLVEEAYHQELMDALKKKGAKDIKIEISNKTDGIIESTYTEFDKVYIFKST